MVAIAPSVVEGLRAEAAREFAHAVLLKPREVEGESPEEALAPLIVQEVHEDPSDLTPGALRVSVVSGHERIEATTYSTITYLWSAPLGGVGTTDECWLRLTLDEDGYPIVAEIPNDLASGALESNSIGDSHQLQPGATRTLYVAASLELAARGQFGDPLPGRRFSIEKGLLDAPTTVVVGTFEDGPMPMGPYVYMPAGKAAPGTVLCRCSPSQVENFVRSEYYELVPLEDTGSKLPVPPPLNAVLRWPTTRP